MQCSINWGYTITTNEHEYSAFGKFNEEATLLQAEVHALTPATQPLAGRRVNNITLYVVNQTVLINSKYINTQVVQCCVYSLNEVTPRNTLTPKQSRAPKGLKPLKHEEPNNSKSGEISKLPVSDSAWQKAIHKIFHVMWKKRWQKSPSCCQTKFWLPIPGCLGQWMPSTRKGAHRNLPCPPSQKGISWI